MIRLHLPIHTRLTHIMGLAFFWGLYGTGILYVIGSPESVNVYWGLFIAITIELCLFLVLIISWIRRHLFLHRTLLPRTYIPKMRWVYKEDAIGYKIVVLNVHMKKDQFITVDCQADTQVKTYKGLLEAEFKPKTKAKTEPKLKAKTKATPQASIKLHTTATKAKTNAKAEPKPKSKTKATPKASAKLQATVTKENHKSQAKTTTKPKVKTKPQAKAKSKTKSKTNLKD